MIVPFDAPLFAVSAAVVVAAYVIFGISAFGASLFTVPLLSHFMPLECVLPMCVLLDVSAALRLGIRFSHEADRAELVRMAPACLVGAIFGVRLLGLLPRRVICGAFGGLEIVYATRGIVQAGSLGAISRRWAPIAGLAGGVSGTLFGVGAPPYALYLSRRALEGHTFRATLSNMVILSVAIRALVFAASGLMRADRLVGFALLLPFSQCGLWLGTRWHARISRGVLLRLVSALVLSTGLSLVMRALAGGP
jgi:uncharacterized membrane protein YfcA